MLPAKTMPDLHKFTNLQVLYLTTTGRVTRLPRTIEIWFILHDSHLYVFAEHHHKASWVRNIKEDPSVHIRLGDCDLDGRARILEPDSDAELWRTVQDVARQKYGWGDGLPVQLAPARLN